MANDTFSCERNIDGQKFRYVEVRRGDNRDIQIIHCVTGAQWEEYRSNNGPISQGVNWYHNHVSIFYTTLGDAIAQEYIDNGNLWPNTITTTIHGTEYTYTKI